MNWKSHIITFLLIFLAVVLFAQTCRQRPQGRPIRPPDARVVSLVLEGRPERLGAASYTVHAEVADTLQKRQQGLSGRPGLEQGFGMLYVYPEAQRPEFSEAGTGFPVSVAFLRKDGTVAEVRKVRENDPTAFRPAEPVSYTLELRAGWFEDRGVGAGARFIIPEDLTAAPIPSEPGADEPPADQAADAAQ